MLTVLGDRFRYCDGLTRRSFLEIGSLSVGAAGLPLCLPQILAAESASGRKTQKSVIMVYMSGGQSHQDTFDLKMEAPAAIRGEFTPIQTSVPGTQICEKLPKMAAIMDKCTVIRSVVGQRDEHTSWQNLTGYPMNQAKRERRPNFGSVVSRIQGQTNPITPAFIDLFPTMKHRPYNSGNAGYLGPAFNQIRTDGENLASMKLRYIDHGRFGDRQKLLRQFDRLRQTADHAETKAISQVDENYTRAFDVLTSSRLVDALDVTKEDPAVRERYGKGSSNHLGDGAPMWNDQLLVARRLVEAGVRVVTVAYGFWDTHGNNFGHLKKHLPLWDTGISALISDLHTRGLDQDVTVCVWDEFGRTPKINKNAGRDHWAPVNYALLAGGGMKMGQMIGTTEKTGGYAESRPVHYRDILATLYGNLGIDSGETVFNRTDVPVPILPSHAEPIRELVGQPD
ncbi:MAG: DUF1501 domain-containing protein [Planctomycetaceae bacterium]